MDLNTCIRDYQLEKIFPKHYFTSLQVCQISPGETICHQGQDLTALSYFIKGKIKVVRRLFNGKEYILDIQNKSTLIGGMELLTDQQAVSSVIALEETWLVQLPLTGVRDQLLSDATLLLKIGQGLAHTLYDQNIRASTNLTYTVKERLASHILVIEQQGRFQLELASLADSFGVSYRHLLRVIHELVNQGIIDKCKPFYNIQKRQELEQLQITN